MKWSEFQSQERVRKFALIEKTLEPTDIECPKCGAFIYRKTDVVLTSYPPQHIYLCKGCGWQGYA